MVRKAIAVCGAAVIFALVAGIGSAKTDVTATPVATTAKAKTVPKVTNLSLPAAERKLRKDGIGYKTKGGGIFGIVIKSDWGVCGQIPSAGSRVKGKVELIVGHYTCGVG